MQRKYRDPLHPHSLVLDTLPNLLRKYSIPYATYIRRRDKGYSHYVSMMMSIEKRKF